MSSLLKELGELRAPILFVLDSFRRISRYSVDLAETTINLLAKNKDSPIQGS